MRVIASPGSIKASETRVQGPDRPYHAVSRTSKHPGADVVDEILLASGNPHKLEEVRAVLVPLGLRVAGLDDLATVPEEPEEDGATFEANARIKAIAYARATGRFSLADDSGLEVDALGSQPSFLLGSLVDVLCEVASFGEGASVRRGSWASWTTTAVRRRASTSSQTAWRR